MSHSKPVGKRQRNRRIKKAVESYRENVRERSGQNRDVNAFDCCLDNQPGVSTVNTPALSSAATYPSSVLPNVLLNSCSYDQQEEEDDDVGHNNTIQPMMLENHNSNSI